VTGRTAENPRTGRYRVLLGAALTLVVASGCSGTAIEDQGSKASAPATEPVQSGGTLTFAADQEPLGFNPLTSDGNSSAVKNVTINLFPGAFRTQPDYTVRLNSDLVLSAQITRANPQTVVYRLRPEATWSDGVAITADDFAYAWNAQNGRQQDLDVAATTGYEDIASVTGSDGGRTVTVTFARPFSDWRSLFSDLLPAHVMRKIPGGWNEGLATAVPVSGGPFLLESYRPRESLTLVRNDAYYGAQAKLDRIMFRFLPDSAAQVTALRNREAQLVYLQPQPDLARQISAAPGVKSTTSVGATFEHITFNLRHPVLADVRVRRAIAFAIDRQRLLDATVKRLEPSVRLLGNRIWMTTQPDYEDHGAEYGHRDVAEGTRLLSEAGFTRTGNGFYEKGGRPLSLRLVITAGNRLREDQALLLKQQLREAGIDVQIQPAAEDFGERLTTGNFDLINFAWTGTAFPVSSSESVYGSGGESNFGSYRNPEVDRLFVRALAELEPKTAVALSQQIDKLLWKDMVSVPLYQKPTLLAYDERYANIVDNTSADGPFFNAAAWGLARSSG
jgi:peptide/nickel transport system substrate-binding protein